MDKLIKKGLEFGLGVTYITAEALNDLMGKLEKEGKISRTDGEKMVRETVQKYQSSGKKYAQQAEAQLRRVMKTTPFATKKDMAEINAKIEQISKQINKQLSKQFNKQPTTHKKQHKKHRK